MADSTQSVLEHFLGRLEEKTADQLRPSDGVYQFHLTGEDGGDWYLAIADGVPRVESGVHADPGVAVTLSAPDFKELAAGRLNAMSAFMGGKLQLTGNMGMAMKLSSLL